MKITPISAAAAAAAETTTTREVDVKTLHPT
jgi:hypothetical protein